MKNFKVQEAKETPLSAQMQMYYSLNVLKI